MAYFIYGLLNPETHLIEYVGLTGDIDRRFARHCTGKDPCTAEWVKRLSRPPVLVILEAGEDKPWRRRAKAGWIPASRFREAVWLKRHRRTIVNKNTGAGSYLWRLLVNPPELE